MSNRQNLMINNRCSFLSDLTVSKPESLLNGRSDYFASFSGIQCHYCAGRETQTGFRSFQVNKGLLCLFVLEGELEFVVDDISIRIDAGESSAARLIYMHNSIQLQRLFKKGQIVKKCVLTLPYEMLPGGTTPERQNGVPAAPLVSETMNISKEHGVLLWNTFATSAVTLPEQLIREKNLLGLLAHYLDASKWFETAEVSPTQRAQKADMIRQYIDRKLNTQAVREQDLQLNQLAHSMNMSVSKLQRLFKDRYKLTVSSYVRQTRLGQAYKLLSDGKITIGEAAYMSGYRHVSNFSNAFKHAYGISPGCLPPGDSRATQKIRQR